MIAETLLSAAEVIEIAIAIEKRGQAFYEAMLDRFPDARLKAFFTTMQEEEERHEALFAELLGEIQLKSGFSSRQAVIVQALAKNHIFSRSEALEQRLQQLSSLEDALALALEFEKDSVVYFSAMRDFVFADEAGVIDALAREEMLHVVNLLEIQKEIIHR
jgi:rubrerythrin